MARTRHQPRPVRQGQLREQPPGQALLRRRQRAAQRRLRRLQQRQLLALEAPVATGTTGACATSATSPRPSARATLSGTEATATSPRISAAVPDLTKSLAQVTLTGEASASVVDPIRLRYPTLPIEVVRPTPRVRFTLPDGEMDTLLRPRLELFSPEPLVTEEIRQVPETPERDLPSAATTPEWAMEEDSMIRQAQEDDDFWTWARN